VEAQHRTPIVEGGQDNDEDNDHDHEDEDGDGIDEDEEEEFGHAVENEETQQVKVLGQC